MKETAREMLARHKASIEQNKIAAEILQQETKRSMEADTQLMLTEIGQQLEDQIQMYLGPMK